MRVKSIVCFMLAVFSAVVFSITDAPAEEKKTVKLGVMQWGEMIVRDEIVATLLKQKGYEVEEVEFFEWGIIFSAAVKGDIDLFECPIDFCTADYWKRFKNKMEKVGAITHGMVQGLVVPSYVPVGSIDQLNDYKDKFDGKIIGLEAGTGLMRQTEQVVKEYGLDFELVKGSTAAMNAALKSAIDKKKWIVVPHWKPSWPMASYDMKWLKDPKGIQQPPQSFYYLSQKGWSGKNAKVAEIVRGTFIPMSVVEPLMLKINEGMSAKKAAQSWIASKEGKLYMEAWARVGN